LLIEVFKKIREVGFQHSPALNIANADRSGRPVYSMHRLRSLGRWDRGF
jgi:hypothetical protein